MNWSAIVRRCLAASDAAVSNKGDRVFRFHGGCSIPSYESVTAGAGPQLFDRAEPIFIRRSFGTAAGLPEFMSEGRDVIVSERGDAIRVSSLRRMFEGLPRLLVSCQVVLFPVLFADTMGMSGAVLQFGGPVDGFRNASRRYSEWTFKYAPSARTCCGRPLPDCAAKS